jgi:catechol 2,3-dioxygenase-like lactoylglutathione lyase family enzyme
MSKLLQPLAVLALGAIICQPGASFAQLSAPNAADVAMGHIHYNVHDVEANKRFWLALGGTETALGPNVVIRFPDVLVLLREAEADAGSEGSVVNHVAFRVQSVAAIEAAGFDVRYNEEYPGVAYVYTPEDERIELFDDELATNLGFTVASGTIDTVADRHNRKLGVPIIAHHIHLFVPEDQVTAARDWYAEHFGGTPGKRWRYDATDFPGINLNFSAAPAGSAALAPTRGRRLDHIGFEVANLEAFCRELEARGIVFDQPYRQLPSGFGLAFLTDPWGTYIELTEGLREL